MQFVGRRSEYWDAARRRENKRAHSRGFSLSATIVTAIWHATRKKKKKHIQLVTFNSFLTFYFTLIENFFHSEATLLSHFWKA